MAILVSFYHFLQLKKRKLIRAIIIILINRIFQLKQYDLKPPRFGLVWFGFWCLTHVHYLSSSHAWTRTLEESQDWVSWILINLLFMHWISTPFDGSLNYPNTGSIQWQADFNKQGSYLKFTKIIEWLLERNIRQTICFLSKSYQKIELYYCKELWGNLNV